MRYDLVVISGAAGFSAVTAAAERGAKVLLVNNGPLGGTYVNFGCVPTKSLLKKFGMKIELKDLVREARKVSAALRKDKYESLLEELGVDYIEGTARFKAKGVLEVVRKEIRYNMTIITVGAKAWKPPIKGLDKIDDRIIDNEKLFTQDYEFSNYYSRRKSTSSRSITDPGTYRNRSNNLVEKPPNITNRGTRSKLLYEENTGERWNKDPYRCKGKRKGKRSRG